MSSSLKISFTFHFIVISFKISTELFTAIDFRMEEEEVVLAVIHFLVRTAVAVAFLPLRRMEILSKIRISLAEPRLLLLLLPLILLEPRIHLLLPLALDLLQNRR